MARIAIIGVNKVTHDMLPSMREDECRIQHACHFTHSRKDCIRDRLSE